MRKRNFVQEIESIRSNLRTGDRRIDHAFTRSFDVLVALAAVEAAPDDSKGTRELRQSLSHYAPICAVACLEGYFRLLIKDLIDYGLPFSENAEEFKEMKFSVSDINAIRNNRITAGEFIAHLLPMNSLSDINRHMTILLGQDFVDFVQSSTSAGHRVGGRILPDARTHAELFPTMIEDIKKVFEVRHILCHELATAYKVEFDQIGWMFSHVTSFINTVEYLMAKKMKS